MDNVKVAAEQAIDTLVTELAAPYFFEKLAAHGITVRSHGEASEIWAAASKLHRLYTAEQEKAAAASVSGLAAVNQQLDQALAAAGLAGSVEKAASFNDVASIAAETPHIAQAVLALQAASAAAARSAS